MTNYTEELLRSVEGAAGRASKITASLEKMTDSDLFAALGQRLSDSGNSGRVASLDKSVQVDDLVRGSAMEELGRRVFRRWNLALHEFVCKSQGEDQDLRQRILHALSGKDGGAVALIAGILVAAFGASPAIAAIVATLLVRLFLNPTKDAVCEYWSEQLKS